MVSAPWTRVSLTARKRSYCTITVYEDSVCVVGCATGSVAVTVTVYVPGSVAGLMVSVAEPVFVVSAAEVAVMVTVAGSPGATVGEV